MRLAYADPPYPGQARKKYRDHPDYAGEVDHNELILRLRHEFPDGWALSTGAYSLHNVLSYSVGLGVVPRIGIWCKSNAMPIRGQRITWSWEAVLFTGGRGEQAHSRDYLRDYLVCGSVSGFLGNEITGQKPPEFCQWLFRLLGLELEDELVDLFPGSGIVGREWEIYRDRLQK